MLRSTIASAFSVLLIIQGAFAALTPDQVVTNIGIVTTRSGNANNALSQLSTTSSSSQAAAIGQVSLVPCFNGMILTRFPEQTLAANFQAIINSLTGDVTAMQATPPFVDGVSARFATRAPNAVTQPIVDALRNVSTNS